MADPVAPISAIAVTLQKTNTAIEISQTAGALQSRKVPLMYPVMDAKTWVKSATIEDPPGGPVENDRYLIPAGATGAWTGLEGYVAEWLLDGQGNGQWYFALAQGVLYVIDTGALVAFVDSTPTSPWPTPIVVQESANYVGDGDEDVIEINAAGGPVQVTLAPALYVGRRPVRVRKVDTTANAVTIYNGAAVVDAIVAPATAAGKINGWRDVSAVNVETVNTLRSEGIG